MIVPASSMTRRASGSPSAAACPTALALYPGGMPAGEPRLAVRRTASNRRNRRPKTPDVPAARSRTMGAFGSDQHMPELRRQAVRAQEQVPCR